MKETPILFCRRHLCGDGSTTIPLRPGTRRDGRLIRFVGGRIDSIALCHNDAEAIIEAVAVLDGDRLREAARGDGEVVEEADVAEKDQTEAVPAIDESHRGFPLVSSAGIIVVVQAQGDGLVASDDRASADGMQFLALVVGQIEAKLIRQQVACEDRVGSGVDQTL